METSELRTSASGGMPVPQNNIPGEIVFDTSSGISMEEQQEILEGINAMGAGSRLIPEAVVSGAKKRGFLFPLFVNMGAILVLGAGLFLLFFFHGQDEQGIRESSATLGLTERRLIQEIRQETNRQISEKEKEIDDILLKLSAADAEYSQLQLSVENMTEEQMERAAALLAMQEEYRSTLSGLQDERAKIIEDSRLREASLRSQAEERVKELSSQIEQGEANLSAAMEELRRLGSEQERAARLESQMAGHYSIVNSYIEAGRFDEAAVSLDEMKELLNAPALAGLRSLETRRQTQLAAIDTMLAAVAEARRLREEALASGGTAQAETIAALEQKVVELERVVAADDSEQSRIIAESAATIETLRGDNELKQGTIDQQAGEIQTQEQLVENLNSQIEAHATRFNNALRTEEELRAELGTASNTISGLREQTALQEELLNSIPQVVEEAIEVPEIQNLLGPGARDTLVQTIQQAIQAAIQ